MSLSRVIDRLLIAMIASICSVLILVGKKVIRLLVGLNKHPSLNLYFLDVTLSASEQGSTVPLVVKWADTEKERLARKAQKALSQASSLHTTGIRQRPSLVGALPMSHMPSYNGCSYQVSHCFCNIIGIRIIFLCSLCFMDVFFWYCYLV